MLKRVCAIVVIVLSYNPVPLFSLINKPSVEEYEYI